MKIYTLALLGLIGIGFGCTHEVTLITTTGKDIWIRNVEKRKDDFRKSETLTTYTWTHYGSGETRSSIDGRILLRFDMNNIPDKAKIKSAKLILSFYPDIFYKSGQNTHNNNALIRCITTEWNEEDVNWINQPLTDSTAQVRLSFPDKTDANMLVNVDTLDITTLTQKMWLQNHKMKYKNYGLQVRLEEESIPYKDLCFASFDHKDSTKRPKLIIVYKK